MNRREFLVSALAGSLLTQRLQSEEWPDDVRITGAVGFRLPTRRSKVAGKNARLGVHGDRAGDRLVRLSTNMGLEGLGNCRAGRDDVARLLGKNPFASYHSEAEGGPRMSGPLGAGTMPLWDLAGKVLNKPAYKLLGEAGPERVPVYDGSIYFADLLPQYADRWKDRFREELDMGRKLGHRAFKIKVGRGFKWMDRQEGDRRDGEVVRLLREHGGDEVILGVDANNGYDLPGAKRFLQRAGDADIAFAEEMFPETVEECLEFKEFIRKHGWKTLLADGETQGKLEAYKPFIEARAIDVFQGDMNRFGIEGILTEAEWARAKGLQVAPHNWGSLVGFYMQLHVGRAISNFYRAEHDPLSSDVLIADGYTIRDGAATLPDAPGFGLALDEEKFKSEAKIIFHVKA